MQPGEEVTTLNAIHLENMLALSRLGVTILPASPGFYHKPNHIHEIIDFIVARILDHLNILQDLIPRWGASHSVILRESGGSRPELLAGSSAFAEDDARKNNLLLLLYIYQVVRSYLCRTHRKR